MIHSLEIRLLNFGNHEDTVVRFGNRECYIVLGDNQDDDESNSNGSGKSWIFRAITKAIYNKLPEKFLKDELVSDWSDEGYLDITLFGEKEFRIVRNLKKKGSDECQIFIDGVEYTESVDKDQFIQEFIGIPYEDFIGYFNVPQDSQFSFFTSGDAYIKKLISRFTDTAFLLDMREAMKEDSDALCDVMDEHESKVSHYMIESETLEKAIEDAKVSAEQRINESILHLISMTEEHSREKANLELELEDTNKSAKPTKESLDKLEKKLVDTTPLKGKIRDIREEIENHRESKATLMGEVAELTSALKQLAKCPKCSHEFSLSMDKPIELLKVERAKKQKSIEKHLNEALKLSEEKEKWQDVIDEQDVFLDEISDLKTVLDEIRQQIKSIERDIDGEEKSIVRIGKEINELRKQLATGVSNDSSIKKHKATIKANNVWIKLHQKKFDKASNKRNELKFWIDKGLDSFRAYMANKVLKVLEGKANKYLEGYGASSTVKLSGFTITKAGDVRERISIKVYKHGESVGSFSKFSGGEKKRVNLCGALAIQDLINESLLDDDKGFDMLMLDEPFDGLDEQGMKLASELLNDLGKTVAFTSHIANDVIQVDNEVLVVKKNKIAKLA